jgi:hypothetical protein
MLHREDSVQVPAPRSAATGGNPANATVSLDELQAVLGRFLEHRMPAATDILIQDLQPLAGGASREAWIFDVSWGQAGKHHEEPCILMREPVASVLVRLRCTRHPCWRLARRRHGNTQLHRCWLIGRAGSTRMIGNTCARAVWGLAPVVTLIRLPCGWWQLAGFGLN